MNEAKEIRVKYSNDQANAHIDSCLYNMPYGVECGSYEYVAEQLKIDKSMICRLILDDEAYEFIVRLK
jgi:hypothetical protein